MKSVRFSASAVVLSMVVAAAYAFAGADDPIDAFELRVAVVESRVLIEPLDDPEWSVSFVLSADNPGPYYVFEGDIDSLPENIPSVGYCFSIEWTEDMFALTSVRGTTWQGLGYSCGETVACEFLINEQGVFGR